MDEQNYIKNSKPMQKMQEITDRLALTTQNLQKFISNDSILKPQKAFGQELRLIQPNKKNEILEASNKKKKATQAVTTPQTQKNEMSVVDWQKKCDSINEQLQEEKKLNQILVQDLNNRQERFVKREMEFRKIIEDVRQELRSKSSLDVNDKKTMDPIINLHNRILENINNIQLKTSKVIVDQERDIMRFFINKINEIKKEYEEERIRKGKKDQDYLEKENQLISELEWIKNIAQKIDNENHTLMKKYMDLKSQHQTQENDREMLLKELIMKKKKNAILKSQIEQYEQLLKEVTKDEEELAQENELKAMEREAGDNNNWEDDERGSFPSLQQKAGRTVSGSKKRDTGGMAAASKTTSEMRRSRINTKESGDEVHDIGFYKKLLDKSDNTIRSLKSILAKEQKRVREIKNLYIKEIESKNELEKTIRKCIEDIKEEIINLKADVRANAKNKKKDDEFSKEQREQLVERLLNNEKILTLVYDKTFHPDLKNLEISPTKNPRNATNSQFNNADMEDDI